MSDPLEFTVDVIISNTRTEIRKYENEIEQLIFRYHIDVIEEAALRLARGRGDLVSANVKASRAAVRQMRSQLATKKAHLEHLIQLQNKLATEPDFRSQLADRLDDHHA